MPKRLLRKNGMPASPSEPDQYGIRDCLQSSVRHGKKDGGGGVLPSRYHRQRTRRSAFLRETQQTGARSGPRMMVHLLAGGYRAGRALREPDDSGTRPTRSDTARAA